MSERKRIALVIDWEGEAGALFDVLACFVKGKTHEGATVSVLSDQRTLESILKLETTEPGTWRDRLSEFVFGREG